MADLGIKRQSNGCNTIDTMWSNLLTFFRKTSQAMGIQLHDIKWKNQRAAPGCAYIPTEIEHLSNIVTHGLSIVPAVLAGLHLVWRAKTSTQTLAAWVYGSALTSLFLVSTIFHSVFYCNRHRQLKDVLHRCDRAMIYVFIAGSYFPWLNLGRSVHPSILSSLQYCVWLLAGMGITYQQMYHERFKCLETFFYIVIGLGPSLIIMLSGHEFEGMPDLKFGGLLYIIGICFFKSDGLIPCAHAIWHLFVVLAATVHYYAVDKYLYSNNSLSMT